MASLRSIQPKEPQTPRTTQKKTIHRSNPNPLRVPIGEIASLEGKIVTRPVDGEGIVYLRKGDLVRNKKTSPDGKTYYETYRIEQELGRGGAGAAYLVTHMESGWEATLKIMPRDAPAKNPRALGPTTFVREKTALGQLPSHRGLPSLFDHGIIGNHQYLVIKHFEGHSLRKTLREQGPLPIADVLDLGIEILSALIAANEAGIIHRDIKPANIIVGSKKGPGRFAILDFGVAKIIDHEELLALEYSQKGHRRIMGSEGYMSPDQQRGNTDIYSDLFSLGATLYQAFTGKRPQKGTSSFTIIPGEVSEENLPTQTLTAFQEALNTMTGTNTNFRPSPAEMLSDLRQIKSRLDLRRRTLSTEPGSIPTIQPTTFTKVPEPSPTTKTRIESKPVITAREPEESQTIMVKADQPVAKVAAKPQAPAYSEDKTRDLRRGSDSAS